MAILLFNFKAHRFYFAYDFPVLQIVGIILFLELILIQCLGAVLLYQVFDKDYDVLGLSVQLGKPCIQFGGVVEDLDHLFAVLDELASVADELVVCEDELRFHFLLGDEWGLADMPVAVFLVASVFHASVFVCRMKYLRTIVGAAVAAYQLAGELVAAVVALRQFPPSLEFELRHQPVVL